MRAYMKSPDPKFKHMLGFHLGKIRTRDTKVNHTLPPQLPGKTLTVPRVREEHRGFTVRARGEGRPASLVNAALVRGKLVDLLSPTAEAMLQSRKLTKLRDEKRSLSDHNSLEPGNEKLAMNDRAALRVNIRRIVVP